MGAGAIGDTPTSQPQQTQYGDGADVKAPSGQSVSNGTGSSGTVWAFSPKTEEITPAQMAKRNLDKLNYALKNSASGEQINTLLINFYREVSLLQPHDQAFFKEAIRKNPKYPEFIEKIGQSYFSEKRTPPDRASHVVAKVSDFIGLEVVDPGVKLDVLDSIVEHAKSEKIILPLQNLDSFYFRVQVQSSAQREGGS